MGRDTEVKTPLWGNKDDVNAAPFAGCDCDLCKDARTRASMLPEQFKPLKPGEFVYEGDARYLEAKAAMEKQGGKKFDIGKSPIVRGCLRYFPRALLAVADVSAYGAKKYDVPFEDQNWRSVPDGEGRYADAEGRHMLKQAINPIDKESGLRHLQMKAWNSLAELELHLTELEKQGIVNFD